MFQQTLQVGESVDYAASGSWVRIDQGERVQIKTELGEKAELYGLDSAQFKPFRSLTITNKGTEAMAIKLRVSGGRIVAAGDEIMAHLASGTSVNIGNPEAIRVNGSEVMIGNPEAIRVDGSTINIATPVTALGALPDVSIEQAEKIKIADANPNRKELIVQAIAGVEEETPGRVRLGGPEVSAGKGLILHAGNGVMTDYTLTTTGEVWAHNETAGTVQITVSEIEEVQP